MILSSISLTTPLTVTSETMLSRQVSGQIMKPQKLFRIINTFVASANTNSKIKYKRLTLSSLPYFILPSQSHLRQVTRLGKV